MNILVTNDDGIRAPGLKAIVKELSDLGSVYVVAPDSERSANSHKLTLSGLLRYEERKMTGATKAYALWGTPADCVHLGFSFFVKDKIDLVVSGINKGPNLSTDIIYSGTIAAAREAFLYHIPSVALSLASFTATDFSVTARYGKKILLKYLEREDKQNYFLSVNVPGVPEEEIKGIRICDKTIAVHYHDEFTSEEKNGKTYINIRATQKRSFEESKDLDIDYIAISNNYISVSALQNEHIDQKYSKKLKEGF